MFETAEDSDMKTGSRRGFGTVEEVKGRLYIRCRWMDRKTGQQCQLKRAVGTDLKRAERLLRQIRVLVDDGESFVVIKERVFGEVPKQGASFADLVAPYLKVAAGEKRESTLRADAKRLAKIVERDVWARADLATLDSATMTAWKDERRASPRERGKGAVSRSTVNREMAIVGAVFKWAVTRKKAPHNPMVGVKRFSEAGTARERYLSPKEISAVVKAAKAVAEGFDAMVRIAIETGMRAGELRSLTWGDVDLSKGQITVRSTVAKTKKGRTIHMTANVKKALRGLRRGVKAAPVFSRHGRPWTKDGLRWGWDHVQAAVPDVADARWHDLRHTAASLMVAAGIPLFDVSKVLGHSTIKMTERYAHFAPEAGRAAAEMLGFHMAKIAA